jgi:hypothetical protein
MKKIYLSILLLTSYCVVNAQVPNAGFETWASGYPTGWSGSAGSTITQDVAHTGTHSAKGTVVGTTTPYLTTPTAAGSMFTISQPYNTLEFYYKSNLVSADIIYITATIYNAAGTTQVGYIQSANRIISANASAFTHASIPIYYTAPGLAAKAVINFTCQYTLGGGTHAGTYFIVDDVSLSGLVAVPEISDNIRMQVYPNPVHDNLKIRTEADGNKPMQIKLTDVLGRVVLQRPSAAPVNGVIEDALNVESYASGLYFLTLVSDKRTLLRRVVVE